MNKQDAVRAVVFMRFFYPTYFQNLPEEEYSGIVGRLMGAFPDDPAEDVALGIRSYIGADQSGIPPSCGEILYYMHKGKDPAGSRDALVAWNLVKHAMRVPQEHTTAAFMTLPDPVQKALGDPDRINRYRAWARTDPEVFETRIQRIFLQTYQDIVRQAATAPQEQEGERGRLQGLKERLSK